MAAAGLAANPATLTPVFDGGTLQLDGTPLSSAYNFTITGNNGTIDLASQSATIGTAITDASAGTPGSLVIANSGSGGALTLTANNGYTGATTLNNGATLALSGAGSIAASNGVNDNGTLDIAAATNGATITTLSGNGAVALGSKNLTLSNASSTFAGVVAGTGALTVAGGTETLTGANTYTGATNVTAGTLTLSGAGSLASTNVTIANGATLSDANGGLSNSTQLTDNGLLSLGANQTLAQLSGASTGAVNLNSHTLTVTSGGAFAGVVAGTGALTVAGGTETLTGANTYTGATTLNNGATLALSGAGSIAASNGVNDNGTLDIAAAASGATITTLSGNGTVALGSKNLTLSNASSTFAGVIAGNGGLTVAGGTETLTGANTYTGATNLNGGTLKVSADTNLGGSSGALNFNGGSLQNTATFSTARNVALNSAGGAFNTDPSTILTLNGTISGSGAITKAGAGTLILAGDNSGSPAHTPGTGWTGGMTINDGLVQVTNPWGLGWGDVVVKGGSINTTVNILTGQTIALAGGTTVNTDAATTTTLSGSIATANGGNTSCFLKTGQGILNVSGSAILSNGTCVQQGLLLANGNLTSNVTVATGAKLGGAGVIHGSVNVLGTLSPGNSPGLLTTTSTVTMLSGSTFQEDIAGTVQASAVTPIGAYGYYSYLHVTGNNQFVIAPNATLSPMLKNIFTPSEAGFANPSFSPSIGQTFRAITADGGISGRFSTLTQPDGLANGTRFAAFYNVFGSNSIDLKVLPTSYAQWLGGSNANTRSAAAALDQILTLDQAGGVTTAQDQLLYITASKNAADLPGFAKALSGEVHGALAAVQPQAGQWLQGAVARRLVSSTTSGTASEDVADMTPGNALWVDLGSNKASWNADGIASGFSSDRSQFSLGVDVLAQKDNRLGFGISHANTNVSADTGSGAVDETMGFVYGQYAYDRYLIDGLVGYGTSTTVSQRSDPTGLSSTLKSSQDSRNALVSAGIRTSWDLDGTLLEPFARVMWQQTSRDGFSEGNAVAALSFTGYSANGIRTLAGVSGNSKTKDPLAAASTYQFSLAVGQDAGDLVHPTIQASLAGINTNIAAPEVGHTFLQANVSGTSRINRLAYAYAGITGETRTGKSDLGVNVGLRMSF